MLRHFSVESGIDRATGHPFVLSYRWVDHEDGSTFNQAVAMPPHTLAIRAGEYGLDPRDTALLLDVVLHETFISYPDNEHPLWHAGSIREAREQHLDTVATVRHEHESRIGERRPKDWPTPAIHRAALLRTAELSPVYSGVVDSARRMARRTWQELQSQAPAPVHPDGRKLSHIERVMSGPSQRGI